MATAKPAEIFDRDWEWSQLDRFISDSQPGATLGIVVRSGESGGESTRSRRCLPTRWGTGVLSSASPRSGRHHVHHLRWSCRASGPRSGSCQHGDMDTLGSASVPAGSGCVRHDPDRGERVSGVGRRGSREGRCEDA